MARPNILDRFRPVGAPGPAGSSGVPADDARGPAWELAPVFEALGPDVRAAQEAVEAALTAAADARRAGDAQAAEIRAQAGRDAVEVRAQAAARVTQAAATADAEYLAQAQHTAAAIAASAETSRDTATARVLEALVAELVST